MLHIVYDTGMIKRLFVYSITTQILFRIVNVDFLILFCFIIQHYRNLNVSDTVIPYNSLQECTLHKDICLQ